MKSWTISELQNVVAALAPLRGLRLQEVQTSSQDVILGFYSSQGLLWLWIDLNPMSPCLLPWERLPLRAQITKTTAQFIFRAHFMDRVLRDVRLAENLGRVVYLRFGQTDDDPEIELRLFPHGRNLLAKANGKRIAWQKPQELGESTEPPPREGPMRDLEKLREEWLAQKGKSKSVQKKSPDAKARIGNEINKKQKALEKVEAELTRKQDLPYKAIGDWLKAHQSLAVPAEWEPFVDKRRKLSWNIEQCFTKARESEGKIFGTEKRLEILKNEIAALEEKRAGPLRETEPPPQKPKPTLSDMTAQGRTLRLADDLVVLAGKSAADNLKILRKARAWDLWFHMRDVPSSHAVLFRNKGHKVGDNVLHEVAGWFVRNHLGVKASQHVGERFDIVVTECRHVRPVKGDKLGRVTFHEERVFTYKL